MSGVLLWRDDIGLAQLSGARAKREIQENKPGKFVFPFAEPHFAIILAADLSFDRH